MIALPFLLLRSNKMPFGFMIAWMYVCSYLRMYIYIILSLSSCYLSTIYVPNSPCIYVLWWTLLLIFCWEWNIGVVFLDNRLDACLTLVDTAKWFWKCLYHLKFPSIMYQFTTDSFSPLFGIAYPFYFSHSVDIS